MLRTEPFIIDVTRGDLVESRHRVSVAVVDVEGRIEDSWGPVDAPIYPRSAVKPLQSLPIVLTGTAHRFGLGSAELALASGSHTGTPAHLALARAMLQETGAAIEELECGAHPPSDMAAWRAMVEHREEPTPLHNNCAGKHLGMIATARHCGEPVARYVEPAHPVQRRIREIIEALSGQSLADCPVGVDGCSAPTFSLPLRALAQAFARFGTPDKLDPPLASACRLVGAAMLEVPLLVAGPGRLSTDVMEAGRGVLLKEGAEGVAAAALPGKGLGIALKVADGAGRAAEVAMVALLRLYGGLDEAAERKLQGRVEPPVKNWRGAIVGRVHPAAGGPGAGIP